MLKRIIGLLISVVLIGSLAYWYLIVAKPGPEKAIAPTVPLFVSVTTAGQFQSGVLMPILQYLPPATGLKGKSELLEWMQVLAPDTSWRNQRAVLGWQISGGATASVLVLDAGSSKRKLVEAIEAHSTRKVNFRDHHIYTLEQDSMPTIAAGRFHNLLILANLPLLVEEALDQLDHPDPESRQLFVYQKKQDKIGGQLYIRPAFLAQLYREELNAEGFRQMQKWREVFGSLRIDIEESGAWSGQLLPDEQNAFLQAITRQGKTKSEELLPLLPANSLYAFHFSVNRSVSFFQPYNAGLQGFIRSWVGEEGAFSMMSPVGGDLASGMALLFSIKDETSLTTAIESLENRVGALETYDYGMFRIRQVLDQEILQAFLPGQQGNLSMVVLGNALAMANSPKTLERLIDQILVGNTIANDVNFKALATTEKGEGRLYVHAGKFRYLLSNWFKDQRFIGGLEQLGMACFELDFSAGAVDFRGQWQYAEPVISEPVSEVIWRTHLEAPAASRPFFLSGMGLFLVQDSSRQLNAIDRNGQLLWSRKLDGWLQSEIQSVDYFGDEERQAIFNTDGKIYLLDAKGEDIGSFPLELQTPAMNGLSLVDFDDNGQFSIFLAGTNGQFYGFDNKGGPIIGWNPHPVVFDRPIYPLSHVQYNNQDYLIVLDQAGQMVVFGKNGVERFPPFVMGQIPGGPPYFQVSTGNPIPGINRMVVADNRGQVLVVNPEGQSFRLALEVGKNQNVQFHFADITGDERKDYLVSSASNVALYNYNEQGFIRQFQTALPQPINLCYPVLFPGATKSRIGVTSRNGQIYLLNAKGEVSDGFPLAGTTAFTMMDSPGGVVLVVGNGAEVYAYRTPVR
ncbi:MAG: hypothetical protein DHS20C18_21800 [Saprospiraceae bacterium]|nr:MAG: hypothetical protein DHS20C18_21800 [Saprospiraceae bacterium]